ncbi:MAG: hypothetical protein IKN34_12685, partial [Treponema sp.]|nr:hypothetical protein [Treponema sp.]
ILESSAFENLSINSIKIVVKLTTASEWWADASAASSWASSTYQSLSWSDSDGGYSAEITSSDFISALSTNGLYIKVANSDTAGTITITWE